MRAERKKSCSGLCKTKVKIHCTHAKFVTQIITWKKKAKNTKPYLAGKTKSLNIVQTQL